MRPILSLLFPALLIALPPGALAQQPGPGERIVEKAIAVQGGRKLLASIGDVKLKLTLTTLGKDAFSAQMVQLYRGPDRLAMVTQKKLEADLIKVYDGSKGKGSFMRRLGARSKVLSMDDKDLAQMREALQRARLLLLPNLFVKGATFTLLSARGRYVKVRWIGPKREVMELHFDSRSTLLKKAYFGSDRGTMASFPTFRCFDPVTGKAAKTGIRLPVDILIKQRDPKTKKYVAKAKIHLDSIAFAKKFAPAVFVDPHTVAKLVPKN